MRLAIRTFLFLFLLYAASVCVLFAVVDRVLERAAYHLMEETTQILGSEIGVAMTDPILQRLLSGRPEEQKQLSESIFELVRRSGTVRSALVVNSRGEPVASTGLDSVPESFPEARELFMTDREPRLVATEGSTLRAGSFRLDIPLLLDSEPMAYMRLTLNSGPVAGLYEEARRAVLIAAGAGLLLIGLLAFLLHVQVARRERMVVRTLEGALSGQHVAISEEIDELRPVYAVAERLGEALSQERARSSAAQESMGHLEELLDVGVAVARPDRGLEFAGREARLLFGLDGTGADAARWEAVKRVWAEAAQHPREGRRRVQFEVAVDGPDGGKAVLCSASPLSQTGESGFIVLARDRSVLRALETDLRQAAQLRGLARLYQGVAHDLKAPLNATVLNLELIRESLDPDRAGEPGEFGRQKDRVRIVEEELARLKRAMEMLLSQTAPANAHSERFDLRELVTEIERLLAAQARQQRITLRVELPAEEIPILAHRDAIRQAALNLAVNGLEAMPDGGSLTLDLRRDGATAILSVRDTGPGVADTVRERLFEMRVTTKATGTGIGLHVARNAVEGNGGSLRLASPGPLGAVFELLLPIIG